MADTNKPRIAKKPVSEKQLIANRMNSKRSTGPRTALGKAKASMNNCRTGMRSSKDILPGEDPALYEERRRNAIRDLAPRNDTERTLVERHVRLEWRGQRGEAAEDARAAHRIHEIVEGADGRAAADAERLARELNESPENVRQLLSGPAGVRLMLGEWAILQHRLARHNSLLGTQRRRALALLGKCRDDALHDDPIALRWVRAQIGAMYDAATLEEVTNQLGSKPPEGMGWPEFDARVKLIAGSLPTRQEAHALLVSYVAEEIRRLEDHLAVVEPLAERNLALDAAEARWDRTAEGARLGQQILASYRGSDAALRRLEALQNPRRPGPGRGPKTADAPVAAVAQQPPAATAASNPEPPAQASATKTDEAISEPAGTDVPTSEDGCLGSQPEGQDAGGATEAGVWGLRRPEAGSTSGTPNGVSRSASTPDAAEARSQPRAVEAISDDPAREDHGESCESEEAHLAKLHQQLEAIYGPRKLTHSQPSTAGQGVPDRTAAPRPPESESRALPSDPRPPP
jgi:hypothetical protein